MSYVPCVPWVIPGSLDFPIPFPIDLDGPFGTQAFPSLANPESTDPGGPLGLPATLESMVHRNWKVCGWDVTGSAHASFETYGYIDHPGDLGTSIPSDTPITGTLVGSWEGQSVGPRFQPRFFEPGISRVMLNWLSSGADGDYPIESVVYGEDVFPLYSLGGGGSGAQGWYIEARFMVTGTFSPYWMQRDGSYYLQHEVVIEVTVRAVPSPGEEPYENWLPREGSGFTGFATPMFTTSELVQITPVGIVHVTDTTGLDPEPSWGDLNLYIASVDPSFIKPSANITLRVRSNFLPPSF